jgi:hypothetical protein
MKCWHTLLTASLIGVSLAFSAWFPQHANSQEAGAASNNTAGRKMIYLFTADFPPNALMQYPQPPARETRFWQLLDKDMAATPDLTLTENPEDADYRVELRCGGVFNCSKLIVDVKTPTRTVLTSFAIKNFAYFYVGPPNLSMVAERLTSTLETRLQLLEKGGYGTTD